MFYYFIFSVICLLFARGGFTAAVGYPSGPVDLKAALSKPSMGWTSPNILSFPGQQSFINATERWTVFDPPTYSASVTVRNEADVVKAVSPSI